MFKFTALLAVATLATSVLAGPIEQEYVCNTAPVQCCNSYQSAQNTDTAWLSHLFNVDVKQITGQAGFGCNPVTGIGKGDGSKCTSPPVCCDDVNQSAFVGINCSPIVANA